MTKKTEQIEQTEQSKQTEKTTETTDNVVSFVVPFPRPQDFEGKTYKELDLSGLEDLTTVDLTSCEQMFMKAGLSDPTKEFNTTFCMLVAHKATGLPLEFFNSLKIPNATAIKSVVSSFLYASA